MCKQEERYKAYDKMLRFCLLKLQKQLLKRGQRQNYTNYRGYRIFSGKV